MKLKFINIFFCLLLAFALCTLAQEKELKFDHITSENGLPQNTIHGIVKDKYGFMWFGTWSGLCRYDGYKFKIYYNDKNNPRSINNNRIHNIIKDSAGDLWLVTFDDSILLKYNYETDDFDRIPKKNVSAAFNKKITRFVHYQSVVVAHGNFRWRIDSATNSLIQIDVKKGTSKFLNSNPSARWSLNDSYVADIYLDDQNIFWVGTYGNGLNKANLSAKQFDYYHHDVRDKNSVKDDNISTFCKDNEGNFWMGTRNKGISVIRQGKPTINLQHKINDNSTIRHDQIRKIFCDSRGFVWIGHKAGLDGYYSNNLNKIYHFETDDLDGNAVYGITEDKKGNIWLATWRGIYKYLVNEKRFIHYPSSKKLNLLRSRTIIVDHNEQIWCGTDGSGLNVFKETTDGKLLLLNHYQNKPAEIKSISDNRIYSIFESADRKIWVATGSGLDLYNPAGKGFQHIDLALGGPISSIVSAILEDDKGNIWVSHKKGISAINKGNLNVTNYSLKDGLQSNEFVEDAAYHDKSNGVLYFGGTSGYNSFVPSIIRPDTTLPKIVLTELQILNKPVNINQEVNGRIILQKPLYLTDSISLSYMDKSVAIEFSGLHFASPEENKYAYMLDGFDKEWIYTDASRRIATYSNLQPGDYIFKVKASNSDGVWNPVERKLHIHISPPFWASIWAYIFYVVIILLTIYLYHYYSTKFTRLRTKLSYEMILHEKENELHKSKLDFFTNISHEIKTPLSLILAPIQALEKLNENSPEAASQLNTMKNNGNRLFRLIDQLLDFRRLETGNEQISLEQTDLAALLAKIVRPFDEVSRMRKVNLVFIAHVTPFNFIIDADKLEKIICNLLSNALKFTPDGGEIMVTLSEGDKSAALITVSDNGIGIAKEDLDRIFMPFQQVENKIAKGTGLGLTYSKALVEQLGGNITVTSERNTGGGSRTIFSIVLPGHGIISDSHLTDRAPEPFLSTDQIIEKAVAVIEKSKQAPKILLVEDNAEMRQYLSDYLSKDYEVFEAANGKEALVVAKQSLVELVISDVMMPEMDGFELCSILKQEEDTSHIPIILLTAKSPVESQVEGLGVGADDYLTKPFNLTILSLKIKNILLAQEKMRSRYKATLVIEASSFVPETADEKLLKKLLEYIEANLSDPDLSVDEISERIFVSKTQLYRKSKALTGLTTVDLIKQLRLKRAQTLLSDKKFNINEVTFMVGFTDANYFRKCFKAEFGVSPSVFAKSEVQE